MRDFIKALDANIWDIIENRYNPILKIKNGMHILKLKNSQIEEEKKKHPFMFKVKWIIFNLLQSNEYERVTNYSTTKDMWDAIEMAYVGTTQVKTSKVHTLVSKDELFKMKDRDSIKDMV